MIKRIKRFEIRGIHKKRNRDLCIVVSPDKVNELVNTAIVVPITIKPEKLQYPPDRPMFEFDGYSFRILLDQVTTVSAWNIGSKHGFLDDGLLQRLICNKLLSIFVF